MQISAQTMMVNPSEIVIDLPVDEQNVSEKMASMKERGVIQPVTIWLTGMRIIDGFHRTQAAINLGWDKIPCHVVDCDEDSFWDARIQSAKQHHKIEGKRLSAWLFEAWSKSTVALTFSPSVELARLYPQVEARYLALFEAVWDLRNDTLGRWRFGINKDRESPSPVAEAILAWLDEKSSKWGIARFELGKRILLHTGLDVDIVYNSELVRVAAEMNLTLGQLLDIYASIGIPTDRAGRSLIRQWIEKEYLAKTQGDRRPLIEFVDEYKRIEKREGKRLAHERAAAKLREIEEWEKTAQGQAETRQRKIERVIQAAEHARDSLQYVDHLIDGSKDFATPIAGCISDLVAFYNKHFPSPKMRIRDVVKVSNSALTKENDALKLRVASLERALNSKTVVAKKIKDTTVVYGE